MPYIGTTPTKVVSRQSANVYRYTATAGQSVFTGADLDNNVLACNPADMIVHMNGLRLESTDYTATSTSVTLTTAATAGDEVTVTSFVTFEVADTYTKTAADDRYVNTTGDTMTGNLTIADGTNAMHVEVRNGTNWTGRFAAPAVGKSAIQYFNGSSWANGVEVDASGRVTMPYQPAWRLQPNHTSNTTGTNHTIPFANVGGHQVYIQGGATVNSSGHVTVPVTGKYFMHVSWRQENYTGDYQISIMQNGLQRQRGGIWYSSQAYENINVTGVFHLAANDYVYVDVSGGGAGNAYNGYNDNLTFFHGYLIG